MTAAQKKVAANFKKAIAYRKQSGCTLKEAFAKVYGKKTTVSKKSAPKKKIGTVGSDSELAQELQQYCDYGAGDFLEQMISGAENLGYSKKQASRAIKLIVNDIKNQLEDSIDYVYGN